jgi:hypothetical protein
MSTLPRYDKLYSLWCISRQVETNPNRAVHFSRRPKCSFSKSQHFCNSCDCPQFTLHVSLLPPYWKITYIPDAWAMMHGPNAPWFSVIWIHIRRCIQKFPDWPLGARTTNGTPLCHQGRLYHLRVSPVSFAAITLCVASQRVFIVVSVHFVIDSVRKLLDTPSYIE